MTDERESVVFRRLRQTNRDLARRNAQLERTLADAETIAGISWREHVRQHELLEELLAAHALEHQRTTEEADT